MKLLKLRKFFRRMLGPAALFSPGDPVAVFTREQGTGRLVVIPATRVIGRRLYLKGEAILLLPNYCVGRFTRTAYWYSLKGSGPNAWYEESALRPIGPNEYMDEDESVERERGVVA